MSEKKNWMQQAEVTRGTVFYDRLMSTLINEMESRHAPYRFVTSKIRT